MGISRQQALECFQSDDLIGIGMEADVVRRRLHPEGVVSYAVECTVSIKCAEDTVDKVLLYDEIGQAVDLGSTGVRLVGGPDSNSNSNNSRIEWFVGVLRGIRQRFPSLWIEGLSATEIVALVSDGGLELREIISRLRDAGLDSIAGDDAHPKCSIAEWIDVHRTAHGLAMQTVAALHFGAGETLEQRVELMSAIRQLQEETGGFAAIVPMAAEAPGERDLDAVTAVEQLKTLAVARIFLDNIENIQWSGAAQGLKVLQTGLRFGANDAGSVLPDGGTSEEDLRRIIRDAGFQPVQRDLAYRTMYLN